MNLSLPATASAALPNPRNPWLLGSLAATLGLGLGVWLRQQRQMQRRWQRYHRHAQATLSTPADWSVDPFTPVEDASNDWRPAR